MEVASLYNGLSTNSIDLSHLALFAFSILATLLAQHLLQPMISEKTKAELKIVSRMRKARSFGDMCAIFGYAHEEYTVATDDGYLLLLQRIIPKEIRKNEWESSATNSTGKRVVFIQHGLLTNSELFMCVIDKKKCLPLVLAEQGYDVWLGNNRGNKYSRRHTTLSPNSQEFWDFSVDDFAESDIPSCISFVLRQTNAQRLNYIGSSQGSAQAFAALSINQDLNDKIDVFIALAPIMRPKGYALNYVNNAIKRNPFSIHTFFGHKSMFPAVSFFQRHLPSALLTSAVDIALVHLLAYYGHNVSRAQKLAGYGHLYCASSVKTVVHWPQIMREGVFVQYLDESKHNGLEKSSKEDVEARRYPTETISTPIVLIYGDRDSLFDLEPALEHLPKTVKCVRLRGYEHLDVLWGQNVDLDVIPRVLESLQY